MKTLLLLILTLAPAPFFRESKPPEYDFVMEVRLEGEYPENYERVFVGFSKPFPVFSDNGQLWNSVYYFGSDGKQNVEILVKRALNTYRSFTKTETRDNIKYYFRK